jgi:hypothetical protein
MSGFYDDMAATALELLAEFGQSVTLSRTTGGSIDPVTGAVTAGTDASVITTGLIKPYPDKMIDGTRILASDRELVLSNEQVPLSTDKPVIGGESPPTRGRGLKLLIAVLRGPNPWVAPHAGARIETL